LPVNIPLNNPIEGIKQPAVGNSGLQNHYTVCPEKSIPIN